MSRDETDKLKDSDARNGPPENYLEKLRRLPPPALDGELKVETGATLPWALEGPPPEPREATFGTGMSHFMRMLRHLVDPDRRRVFESQQRDNDAEDVAFSCEHEMEDQDMTKTTDTLPTEGKVNLNRYREMLNVERVLETIFHEDDPVQQPESPDDSKPARSTRVDAVHLGWLLSLCAEGADEGEDDDTWDDEEMDEEKLQYYLDRLAEYLDDKMFVSLLEREPEMAVYFFHRAVIDQPYVIGEDGEIMFTLDGDV